MSRKAFTLIELLVVVAIITILAAILLPSLQRAKDSAQAAKCLNNLKQIGVAAMLYADDNNGLSPRIGNASLVAATTDESKIVFGYYAPPNSYYFSHWIDDIFLYCQKNIAVLECPAQKTKRSTTFYQMASPYPPRTYYPGYMISYTSTKYTPNGYWQLPLNRVTNPQAIWFVDACLNPQASYGYRDGFEVYGAVVSSSAINASNNGGVGAVSRRHQKGSNFVCYDGHAEWQPYDKIQPINDPESFNGNAADNAIFRKYWDVDNDGIYCNWNYPSTWDTW